MKKILIFVLTLTLCLALVACGGDTSCTSHTDADSDGKCDSCGAAVEPEGDGNGDGGSTTAGIIELVKNGSANFQIVSTEDTSIDIGRPLSNFVKTLNECISEGNVVAVFEHKPSTDIEIIIGNVATRGDKYTADKASPYAYGYEGWSIQIVDNNIHVLAGSNSAYKDALEYLEEAIFGIDDSTAFIDNVTMTADQAKTEVQTDFDITVTIAGNKLSDYVFAIKSGDSSAIKAINGVRMQIFKKTGVYLPTVVANKLTDDQKAIWIETLELDGAKSTPAGSKIYVEGNDLHIECEFKNKIEEVAYSFLVKDGVDSKKATLNIKATTNTSIDVRNIYYAQYGAVGDGVTDDFFAIKACHDYANEWGHTANADGPNKTYYIGNYLGDKDPTTSIIVQTDTNWHGCTFIFDDSVVKPGSPCYNSYIFHMAPSKSSYAYSGSSLPVTTLTKGTPNLGEWQPGIECILYIESSLERHYIRYGSNNNNGSSQQEILYVHADGTIDESTPLQWDYEKVTRMEIFPVDTKPITVTGGDGDQRATIITKFNSAPSLYTYYQRNLKITRSFVTLQNIDHIVEGEEETGAPYSGFTSVSYATNVTIQNMLIHRLKSYYLQTDPTNNMGSYEIGAGHSNNVLWKNIVQDVFFDADGGVSYKGVMGTNYCKNLTFDGNFLCSFDAHCGVYNGTIKNTTIEHINFIGDGLITIENCTVYADGGSTVINLRSDYGSWWKGDAIFKNVEVKYEMRKNKTISLFSSAYTNHDFGYTTYLPANITLDNLKLLGFTVTVDGGVRKEQIVETNTKELYLFSPSIYNYTDVDISDPNAVMTKNPNDWVICTCETRPESEFYSSKYVVRYFNDTDGDGRCNNVIKSRNGGTVWCWGFKEDPVKTVNANPYIGTKTVTIINEDPKKPLKVKWPFTPQFKDLDVTVDGELIIENGTELAN